MYSISKQDAINRLILYYYLKGITNIEEIEEKIVNEYTNLDIKDVINKTSQINQKYITFIEKGIYPDKFHKLNSVEDYLNNVPILFYEGNVDILKDKLSNFITIQISDRYYSELGLRALFTDEIIKSNSDNYILVANAFNFIDKKETQLNMQNLGELAYASQKGIKVVCFLNEDVNMTLYPDLAKKAIENIIKNGGLVISEFSENFETLNMSNNFINSNYKTTNNFKATSRLAGALGDLVVLDAGVIPTTDNTCLLIGHSDVEGINQCINARCACDDSYNKLIIKNYAFKCNDIYDAIRNADLCYKYGTNFAHKHYEDPQFLDDNKTTDLEMEE